MTRPHYVQVEGWQRLLCGWLSFGAIWLRNWELEGAGDLVGGCWTFTGVLELPFGPEDADELRDLLWGPHRAEYLEEVSRRLSMWATASTQLPEPW